MALTLQEFGQKVKQKYPQYQGVSDQELAEKVLQKYPQYQSQVQTQKTPAPEKKPGFLERVGQGIDARYDSLKKTGKRLTSGEQGITSTLLQGIGEGVGAVGDVVAEGITSGFRALPDKIETPIRQGASAVVKTKPVSALLGKVGEAQEKFQSFEQANPVQGANTRALANILSAIPVGKGAQVGAKGATQAAKQTVETIAKVPSKTFKATTNVLKKGENVAKDIVPTRKELISGQITKALDLTQGDVSNIKLSTRNEVGDWIAKKNLIGGNKKETLSKIKDVVDTQYKKVREEVGKVKTIYKPEDVPRVRESLEMIQSQTKDVLGQEDVLKEVQTLLQKENYTLNDVQRTKELIDDQFNLYKATGDVKEGQAKAGLDKVRRELKRKIEKDVKETTGADISSMNNDVQTGREILNLAEKRSTRGFTRANVSLADLGYFATGSFAATPIGGVVAVLLKRIIETPTMQLKFAKYLNSLPKQKALEIQKEMLRGKVPAVIKTLIKKESPAGSPILETLKKVEKNK